MSELPALFWLFLKASLLSTGGTGNLPILHDDLLARGLATEQQFAEALAVGQISPGPSGLWVVSLGYLAFGGWGAALATAAIIIPPLAVLLVDRLHRRAGGHPAVRGLVRGLNLAVVGVSFVVMLDLWRAIGVDLGSAIVLAGSVALALTGRVPVPLLVALAALAGVLLYW